MNNANAANAANQPANAPNQQPANAGANQQPQQQQQAANNAPANQQANANLQNIFNNLGVNFQNLVASTLRQYPRRVAPQHPHGSIAYRRSRFPFPSVTDLANWALASAIKRELIRLHGSITTLRASVVSQEDIEDTDLAAIRQSQEAIIQLEKLLRIVLDGIPIEARPNAYSAVKAQKVFDVAELLEKILLNCDYADMLSCGLVNRTFNQAFQRSARLQQVMGQRPITDGSPFSPVSNPFFISRGCIVRLEDHHRFGHQLMDNEIVVSAIFNGSSPFEEHPLPRLSEKFRNTLVCQPPIKQMRIRAGERTGQSRF